MGAGSGLSIFFGYYSRYYYPSWAIGNRNHHSNVNSLLWLIMWRGGKAGRMSEQGSILSIGTNPGRNFNHSLTTMVGDG